VKIFPNPSNNMVYIHLAKPSQNYSIAVFSAIGQQLIKTSNNPAVDISMSQMGFI
jgi:hypothetical protein